MLLFIISLGTGNLLQIFGIRIVYITTFIMLAQLLPTSVNFAKDISNKHYRKIVGFGLVWLLYPFLTFKFVRSTAQWIMSYREVVIILLITYLLVRYIKCEEDWLLICKGIVILLVIMLVIGGWEILTGSHLPIPGMSANTSWVYTYHVKIPTTFYVNENDNASVLFLCMVIAILYFACKKKNFVNIAACSGLVIATVYQIVISGARAVIYSIPFTGLFMIYFLFVNRVLRRQKKYFIVFCLVTGVVLCTIIFLLHPLSYYIGLFSENYGYIASGNYSSDLFRVRIIKDSFNAFIKTFGIGLGPGQSIIVSGINLHNFYLEIVFEYGILIGGYFIIKFLGICFTDKDNLPLLCDVLIKSMPFVFIILGISASHLFSIKVTWITIVLFFCMKYNEFNSSVKTTSEKIIKEG